MDERMMVAELRRLERALAARKKELDELEAKIDLARPRNRRYNADFSFAFVDDATQEYIYVDEKAPTVAKGTRFFVLELELGFQIVSDGAAFNMGPTFMRNFFDFEWRVRDTGSDRDWSNDWLPSQFLFSGDVRGFCPKSPFVCSGGADIVTSVRVTRSRDTLGEGDLFTNIEAFELQIGFVGVEVPEAFEPFLSDGAA